MGTAAEGARLTAGHDTGGVPRQHSCHLGGETNADGGGHEQTGATCGRDCLGSRSHRRRLMRWK
jgi:hypothetical protein